MSKLLTVLINKLNSVKESSKDITLDFSKGKDSVYEDLLIPLMNLTESDDLTQLHDNLNILINETESESDAFKKISNALIEYIMEDNDNEVEGDVDLYDEFENIMLNCMAMFNSLKSSIENNTIEEMNNELTEYINSKINSKFKVDHDTENKEDDSTKDSDDKEEDNSDKEENTKEYIKIISTKDQVDDGVQGDVNKIELKNTLMDKLEAAENDKDKEELQKVIDETFALALSYEKTGDWKQPHHVLKDEELILNVNGLKSAALFLLKPNTSKNLSSDERTKIATHLTKHYDEMEMEKPDRLTKIANNTESTITVNIKEDELKEYAESFDTNVENVTIYIGLFEALVTDLVNSGIIDIKDKAEDFDESLVSIQLSKGQVEEFLKYFDIMSDDILNILSNNLGSLSYKKTDKELTDKLLKSESIITELKEKVSELSELSTVQKTQLDKASNSNYDKNLVDNKFEVIINFIKASDIKDETLIQFINNVIEAESDRDIGYLTKLGKSFMNSKVSDSTQFVKKSKVINRFSDSQLDELLDVSLTDNKESTIIDNDRVSRLAEYL